MPEQTPYITQPRIRLREGRKLATTGITNEISEAVNKMRVLPRFGQVIESTSPAVVGGDLPTGQYPGQVYQVRTNNSSGFEFVQFTPPVMAIPSP